MSKGNGAVDLGACKTRDRWRNCRCERCKVCGWPKHTAVHGPSSGETPGSEPWDHEFEPEVSS